METGQAVCYLCSEEFYSTETPYPGTELLTMIRATALHAATMMCFLVLAQSLGQAADKPLARIAVVSNPYITTLPASE